MKKRKPAGGAAHLPLSRWRSLMLLARFHPLFDILGFLAFCLLLGRPCAEKDHLISCPDDFDFSGVWSGSDSLCFPSTLTGFPAEQDSSSGGFTKIQKNAAFKMSKGGTVSCSVVDLRNKHDEGLNSVNRNVNLERVESFKESLVSNVWQNVDEYTKEIDTGLLRGTLSPMIEISPRLLDWGTNSLYSPSVAVLSVTNTCNDSVLGIYDLFSSNTQFYAYNFIKLSLAPGESASVPVVFLPRLLGLSSAHLVLQTSFGGFIIHAKAIAIESPFRVEPLVGFDISLDEGLSGKLSLYNPYNDVLFVEEVATLFEVSSQNRSHSSRVVCSQQEFHQFSHEFGSLLNGEEWFTVEQGIDVKPHKQWEVRPHSAETLMELNLLPHSEGRIYGAICIQFQKSMKDRIETVVVPLDVEVHGRAVYGDLNGSVSVYFEPVIPGSASGSIISLFLRNDEPNILNVGKISEVTENLKLFEVKYTEGLTLFPGTVTLIALISHGRQSRQPEVSSVGPSCVISISTNASDASDIQIPCQDLIQTCCTDQTSSDLIGSEGSNILISQRENKNLVNPRTGSLGSISEDLVSMKLKHVEAFGFDELMLRNWKSQATMSEISVLKDQELVFPVVEVGTHLSKWITVHNPSPHPVVMQLLLNSGGMVDRCKFDEESSKLYTFSNRLSDTNSIDSEVGFSISPVGVTEAFVPPSGIAQLGPITFHPSRRCMWRSSVLIRNNLSGIEWMPLQAFGGSASLILLEGSEPVSKLEFNLDLPRTLNASLSDLISHSETTVTPSCGHVLSKELVATNNGELPLEVKKVEVSGNDCGLDGFVVDNCEGFLLAPGESTRLIISYQSDFSSAVVHRDLMLAMVNGILVIPMQASLPVYMINLCKKWFFFQVHWKPYLLGLAAVFILFLMVSHIIPHAFYSGNENGFVKGGTTVNTIDMAEKPSQLHRNARNSRSFKEAEKPRAGFVSKYPTSPSQVQHSSKTLQGRLHSDDQKTATLSPKYSTSDQHSEFPNGSDVLGKELNGNLTVRTVKERAGKRRKKRRHAGGLASKFEVSSSQSGNSTPSSPLSPSPLQISGDPFSRVRERNLEKNKDVNGVHAEVIRHLEAENLQVSGKSTGRILLPCATFPGPNWRAPGVIDSNFLTLTSPIAPHARAPGSKLGKDNSMKEEENDAVEKELTYDIWGNHFSGNIFGRMKNLKTKLFDASEGDSQSFFARDPQSLMMMSSARSVSPGSKLSACDVSCHLEME